MTPSAQNQKGGDIMITVTFWTLNPNLPPNKIAEAASKLMEKGLFPVKGVKDVLGFYITPGCRGVTITELKEGFDAGEVGFRNYDVDEGSPWPIREL